MNPQNDDERTEHLLRQWRPAPPDMALRDRVLERARAAFIPHPADELPLWLGLRPLALAVAASAALLIVSYTVSSWLVDGAGTMPCESAAWISEWTARGEQRVRCFDMNRAISAHAVGAIRLWREKVSFELAKGTNGGES